jgi:hypothetical protein
MAVSSTVRAAALLVVALALALSGTWLALSPASGSPARDDATLLVYHGTQGKASLPLAPDRLPGAPAAFRSYVKTQLHAMWDGLGHTAGCKSSPLITVDALRTDGFAMGGVNTVPRKHCRAGGGYAAIWAVRHGEWKLAIATQDVIYCATLERFGIPSEIGVHECYQDGETVPYDHP